MDSNLQTKSMKRAHILAFLMVPEFAISNPDEVKTMTTDPTFPTSVRWRKYGEQNPRPIDPQPSNRTT
ncbi:hypothetical protein TNCV_1780191 [Trichonephila clavipes]|nr:hypothetical protein TNCV_1780191 [Trichonephila clavipes]